MLYRFHDWLRGAFGPYSGAEVLYPEGYSPATVRQAFRNLKLPHFPSGQSNPHGLQASQRAAAREALLTAIEQADCTPYIVQPSKALSELDGSLIHLWDVDTLSKTGAAPILEDSVLFLVDVDPYVDPSVMVADTLRPVFLYGPSPKVPFCGEGSYQWTTNADNTFTFVGDGFRDFTHPCWDYGNRDMLTVRESPSNDQFFAWTCPSYVALWTDARRVSDSHVIASLVPCAVIQPRISKATVRRIMNFLRGMALPALVAPLFLALSRRSSGFFSKVLGAVAIGTSVTALSSGLASLLVVFTTRLVNTFWRETQPLKRLRPVSGPGSYARLDFVEGDDRRAAISQPGRFTGSITDARAIDQLDLLVTGSDKKPTSRQAASYAQLPPGETINELLLNPSQGKLVANHAPMAYVHGANVHDDTAKLAKMTPLMSSLGGPRYTPAACLENEEASIVGRVERVANPYVHTREDLKVVDEFVAEMRKVLVRENYQWAFKSLEDILEACTNPRTKAQLKELGMSNSGLERAKKLLSTFIKAEAYEEPKDPRNITTFDSPEKLVTALAMGFVGFLKAFRWYGFLNPEDLNDRIRELLQFAANFSGTDFNRFDGRKNQLAAVLITRTTEMLATFLQGWSSLKKEQRDFVMSLLLKLMKLCRMRRAMTKHGRKYDTMWSQLSGHLLTSDDNSLFNAFNGFKTLRRKGISPQFAMRILEEQCLFGGDDGVLGPAIQPDEFEDTANAMGLHCTKEVFPPGQLTFFSRTFTLIRLNGNEAVTSVADIRRSLGNLSLGNKLADDSDSARQYSLYLKCKAVQLTDEYTPVLGEFASTYVVAYEKYVGGTRSRPTFLLAGSWGSPLARGAAQGLGDRYGNLLEAFARAGVEVPWKLRHGLYEWQPGGETDEVVDLAEQQLSEFNRVEFEQWLNPAQVKLGLLAPLFQGPPVTDTLTYLRNPPGTFWNIEWAYPAVGVEELT